MSRAHSRAKPRGVLVPAVAGSLALVTALVLAYVTVRDTTGSEPAAAESSTVTTVETHRVVSRQGGFAVAVPDDMEATRTGTTTVRLVSASKDLAVMVGPAGGGSLGQAEKRLVAQMRRTYPAVTVLGDQATRVDGYPAGTVFGHAVNSARTKLRFAVITIHAGRRNYSVASYAAYDAYPARVLPRVNAVANGFTVLRVR
jgi:hypothetical protein